MTRYTAHYRRVRSYDITVIDPFRATTAGEAAERIAGHGRQYTRGEVTGEAMLAAVHEELARNGIFGERSDTSAAEAACEAAITLLYFLDRDYIRFEGNDAQSAAVTGLREMVRKHFPDRYEMYMQSLLAARARDALAEPSAPSPGQSQVDAALERIAEYRRSRHPVGAHLYREKV